VSALLEAVASPRRQAILRLVWKRERSAGDIHEHVPEVTFGAVSQHLKVLERAGAVTCRKAGRQRFYRARPAALGPLALHLEALWSDALAALKLRAEAEEARRGPRRSSP
jgi:DNA-binding transcriptional ArsR family regulator